MNSLLSNNSLQRANRATRGETTYNFDMEKQPLSLGLIDITERKTRLEKI